MNTTTTVRNAVLAALVATAFIVGLVTGSWFTPDVPDCDFNEEVIDPITMECVHVDSIDNEEVPG